MPFEKADKAGHYLVFGLKLQEEILVSLLVAVLLCIFACVAGAKIKKADPKEKPKGLVNVLELFYTAMTKLIKDTMGEGATRERLTPYICTLAIYLAAMNLIGLFGLKPPTSSYSVTLSMALITFVMTQYYGLKTNKLGGYIKGYFEPMAGLFILNILGEIANPISLSFRLFGNILSGVIIMGLLYQALGLISPLITPWLHMYFDIFSGLIQTFIFLMLTMIFVGGNLPEKEEV